MDEQSLFIEALGIPDAAGRAAFLDQACAGDVALRQRLDRLLQRHQQPDSFLRQPAAALLTTSDEPLAERPGSVIGPYKLLEQIGEGGFGIVFMAEQQQPIRRKVALKVLKPGMDTNQVIARFEAERQALALMDHPNIAKVLDAGTLKAHGQPSVGLGRPYFVMELVKGIPITEYCDQGRLTPSERLDLFLHVCQAVQHAHQKGIIHRDIKPSNVLVTVQDGTPLAKVIDFGIAKALGQQLTDKTLFTGFAQMLGTSLYMSPEQAALSNVDVDTRSDIYSLGVLLYELLTGTTPFDKERLWTAGYDEMRRIIREEEPPKPSTRLSTMGQAASTASANRKSDPRKLSQLFRGELDWIVMKALDKDRNRRYESASAFAADVQRYLADEPVQACPPSAWYRFGKFARRHKAALAVASAAAIVVVLGVVGLAVGYVLVKAEKENVLREKERGDQHLARAKKVMNDYLANTANDRRLKAAGLHELRKNLLLSMVSFLEDFARQEGDDRALRVDRGWAQFNLGHIWAEIGDSDKALAQYDQGRATWEKLAADFPDAPGNRENLADCENNRGVLLTNRNRLDEAEQSIQHALTIREQLAAEFPSVASYHSATGGALNGLAVVARRRHKLDASKQLLEKAVTHQKAAIQIDPHNREARRSLAGHYTNLGVVLMELGQLKAAAAAQAQSRAVFDGLLADFPTDEDAHFGVAECCINLGNLHRQKQPAQAVKDFREGAAIIDKLHAEFPAVPGYLEKLTQVNYNLWRALSESGREKDAETTLDKALRLNEQLVKQYPGSTDYATMLVSGLMRRGSSDADAGRFEAALRLFARAAEVAEPLAAPARKVAGAGLELSKAHGAQADVLLRLGRHAEALKHYNRALALEAGDNRLYFRVERALALAHLKEHLKATAEAAEVAGEKGLPAYLLQDAAGVHAVCSAAVRDDAELSEQYAVKAIALLRKAFEKNYQAIAKDVRGDKNLDTLRSRADFKKLMSEWEGKQPK